MTQATTLKTLIQGNSSRKDAPQKLQKCKTSNPPRATNRFQKFSHPKDDHPFQLKSSLRSQFWTNTSSLHTPLNPALTQLTSPLSNPPFDKSNIICAMRASPNLRPTYTLLSSDISWPSIPCLTHFPFLLQTTGIPNYMVWATTMDILDYMSLYLHQDHFTYQTTCPHSTNQQYHHSTKGHHDNLYGSNKLLFV